MTDPPTKPLRVGIWAAVSTKPQAEKVSLAEQEAKGREWAANRGATEILVYTVPGESRDIIHWMEAEARIDAYRQYRLDCEAGRIDAIWMYDTDRCGRDPALSNAFGSIARKAGVDLFVQTISQSEPAHPYVFAIQAQRAQEDQQLRVYRLRSGMEGRIKSGLPPGSLPCGYRHIRDDQGKCTGAEFTDDIGAVKLATRLFLEGQSYQAIARALTTSPWRPPMGGQVWRRSTIRAMLHRDTFAGFVRFGDVVVESDVVPALWDHATYASILRERRRRARPGHTRQGAGPLSGVAFCRRCGGPMYRLNPPHRAAMLRCGNHTRGHEGQRCHANHILERLVLDALAEYLARYSDPQEVAALVAGKDQAAGLKAELTGVEKALASLHQQAKRQAFAFNEGVTPFEVYKEVQADITTRTTEAQRQADELQRLIATVPDVQVMASTLSTLSHEFRAMLDRDDAAFVSTRLQNAGLQVRIERESPDEVVIEVAVDL